MSYDERFYLRFFRNGVFDRRKREYGRARNSIDRCSDVRRDTGGGALDDKYYTSRDDCNNNIPSSTHDHNTLN